MREETICEQLSNGLQILMHADPQGPLVAMQMGYRGGSCTETSARSGLAHLCEHLALRGPRERCDYLETIERVGGLVNGSTSYERTVFEQTLPADQLRLGLSVEARRMRHPVDASQSSLEKQRRVLTRELRQRRSSPSQTGSVEQIQRLLYPGNHPYSFNPAGTVEGIRAIERQDVEAYCTASYAPSRAVLTIAGNFDPDEARSEIQSLFAPIGAAQPGALIEKQDLAPFEGPQYHLAPADTPVLRSYAAFRGPGFGRPGWATAALWLRSLCIGRSSLLQRRLIEEAGVAQQIKGGTIQMYDSSTLIVEAVAASGVGKERLETALVESLERLLDEGIDADTLRRARRKAANDHYFEMQRLERRADYLGNGWSSLGECVTLDSFVEQLESLTTSALQEFGRTYAAPARRLIVSTPDVAREK